MTRFSQRKFRTLLLAGSLMAIMVGLVAYSPTLYRMFCAATGYGGTVQRAVTAEPAAADTVGPGRRLTVYFDSNVAPQLGWEFQPEQRKVEVRVGEPTKIYYKARNLTDRTVVGRAVYNVTPFKVAPYFFKIECFCFTQERLGPGESARMPVVFYIDEQMLKDSSASRVHDITLSYTFFKQSDLSPEEVQAARDLKAGSRALDADLESEAKARFDNDAPRR